MNSYARLNDLRTELQGTGSKTSNDPILATLAERASRIADDLCRRHFYARTATRYVEGNSDSLLWLPFDLVSVTTLKVDQDGDSTYETTLAVNTDYWLVSQRGDDAAPYIGIRLNPRSATLSRFPLGYRAVQIVGVFGYDYEVTSTGLTGTVSSESDTTVTASGDASSLVSVGDTLVMGSEQMDVLAVTGTTITVTRAINGTTAATHSAVAISRRVFPPAVVQAVTMQVARMFREGQSGFSGDVGSPDTGYAFRTTYPAIRDALRPFVAHQAAA